MGCASIHLCNNWVNDYLLMRLSTSNKGWHLQWFNIKDDMAAPLPVFSRCLIEEVPGSWKWGVRDKDKKRIKDHLATLQILKDRGVKGSGIIGAFHTRRVAPLMSRALPLYLMAPGASPEGTALVDEALPPTEVAQRIKEAMEPSKDTTGIVLDFIYPVPGHPLMRQKLGFVDFISCPFPCLLFT